MNPRRKILLVDDNDNTLDLLELFLYDMYDLVTAENGFEGLKVAEHEQPDLILTDIMMPVMDGIAFINELRRREQTAHIPVIAITSFAEQATVKSLLSVGFCSVVAKPFRRDDIIEKVKTQLGEDEPPDDRQAESSE
ncbi:MAG: response regulator [Chitinivibrionales bacterium]|nr:response regulator [Chitinivibrionales bacterium]